VKLCSTCRPSICRTAEFKTYNFEILFHTSSLSVCRTTEFWTYNFDFFILIVYLYAGHQSFDHSSMKYTFIPVHVGGLCAGQQRSYTTMKVYNPGSYTCIIVVYICDNKNIYYQLVNFTHFYINELLVKYLSLIWNYNSDAPITMFCLE